MHFGAGAAVLVVGIVLFSILISVLLPVAFVAALVWIVVKTVDRLRGGAAARSQPTMTATETNSADRSNRDIGWAVGLLVAGVLWCAGRHFAALLLGAGAAILVRGLLDMRRARPTP